MKDACLELIDLDQQKYGFRKFFSSWLYQKDELTFLVDPGPHSTVDRVIHRIRKRKSPTLDFILLTHIHLDHAGGTAEIIEAFPDSRVYCHEKGRYHLIDPSRLWQASCKVMKEESLIFGEPTPVPKAKIVRESVIREYGVHVAPTPGHAPHHVSYVVDGILFAGEAVGARFRLPGGAEYLRPSTPPRCMLDVTLESLDKILALDPEPERIAFGHYGLAENVFDWCRHMKEQLVRWVDLLQKLHSESENNLEERFFKKLMEIDPFYGQGRFDELPKDIQHRERGFFATTMKGMLGYIQSNLNE